MSWTVEGQGGGDDRGGGGHRPRHRRGVRRRGGAGDRDRHRSCRPRRAWTPKRAGSTCVRARRSRSSRARSGRSTCCSIAPASCTTATMLECSDADWDFSFDLNVKSMHRTIRAFLPGMLEKGGGSIVNVASAASSVRGIPNRYVYGASQSGGDRPDQGGRGRFHPARRALQRDLPGHGREPLARPAHRDARAPSRISRRRRCARPSSTVSRWAASASPRRSRCSRSIWPPTKAPSPPARSISPTAGSRCRGGGEKPDAGFSPRTRDTISTARRFDQIVARVWRKGRRPPFCPFPGEMRRWRQFKPWRQWRCSR